MKFDTLHQKEEQKNTYRKSH